MNDSRRRGLRLISNLAAPAMAALLRLVARRRGGRRRAGRITWTVEAGGGSGVGVRRWRPSSSRRGIRGSYVLAPLLLAMIGGVAAFPGRAVVVDGVLMVALVATAAVWYLRDAGLAGAAVVCAALTWCTDPNLPGPIAAPLRWAGVPNSVMRAKGSTEEVPSDSAAAWARRNNRPSISLIRFNIKSVMESVGLEWRRRRALSRAEAQEQLYRFLILNSLSFGVLAAVAVVHRKHRVTNEQMAWVAARHRELARLRRLRV